MEPEQLSVFIFSPHWRDDAQSLVLFYSHGWQGNQTAVQPVCYC